MFKISFENVIRIIFFKYDYANDYAHDLDKMVCHCINNVIINLFYNDSEMATSNLIWV